MPVNEGIEKKVPSHADGDDVVMLASLVKVTTKGLLDWPEAPTTSGVVRLCVLPLVPVE